MSSRVLPTPRQSRGRDVVPDARLWVTGTGLVTPLGSSVAATWGPLVRGERAIGPLTLFDTTGQRTALAAQVRDLDVVRVPEGDGWSRTGTMALVAAREAMREACIDPRDLRIGLVVGVTTSGMFETEALLAELHASSHEREVLRAMLTHPLTSTGDRLVETLGPFARVRTICSACSSGANAFIAAAAWLLEGELDAVVAGGADGLCRLTLTGFNALSAMDAEPCRPFDARRRGLSLGEGAGFIVLERDASARARGARPIAELAGWASGADAHHITNPEPTGEFVSRLITRALTRAQLGASDIDYVNAHGTGTPRNDTMEAAALSRAFGREIERIAVSSSKGQIGHTLGAAGAIEGIFTALAVERQTLLPTAGLDEPDPACRLVHVPHVGRAARVRVALSISFGFGGMNAVLVFAEPAPERVVARAGRARHRVVVTGVSTLSPFGLGDSRDVVSLLSARPASPRIKVDLDAHLDETQARRLDRHARLGALVVQGALAEAGRMPENADTFADTGVILGSAFGSVDASAAFMHRVFEKGPRFASPAEFPNLVPSSPVGHVSIYLGLRGPVLATADLSTSGESALAQAVSLIEAGDATRIVAGGVDARGDIVERVLLALFARSRADAEAPRAEGAAAIVVEAEEAAAKRGARVLARVTGMVEWRGDDWGAVALPAPRDASRAEVVLPRENGGIDAILAETRWRSCPHFTCAAQTGEHDVLGAVAFAAAVGRIASGAANEVLVVGLAQSRGYAFVLEAP